LYDWAEFPQPWGIAEVIDQFAFVKLYGLMHPADNLAGLRGTQVPGGMPDAAVADARPPRILGSGKFIRDPITGL